MLVRKFFQGPAVWCFQPLMAFEANPADLGGGSSQPGTEGGSDGSQGSEGSGYSSFVQELLKDAPPEHVSIMEPYIKKFDAGSTRRFQDLRNQYKHYDSLGWDEETTQQMAEVYRVLNEEPERMYEALKEIVEGEAQKPAEGAGDQSDQSVQGLPPEVMQQLTQQQQVLEALAQYVLQDQSSKNEAVEDKEFEDYMGLLKQEYGNFDDQYVTAMIANGIDGEAAVKQWQQVAQEILNQANEATSGLPPAILSSAGGGAVSQAEPQKLGSIDSRDIRSLIANVMTQANQAGQ